MQLATVILAAGQGTRMKSALPKVLHPLGGWPMVRWGVETAWQLTGNAPVLVVGHGGDQVKKTLGERARYVEQAQQLGTGHAVLQAEPVLLGQCSHVLVYYADNPLLTPQTLQRLVDTQAQNTGPLTMLTVVSEDTMNFGRIVRNRQGQVEAIVEEAVATPEQRQIKEINVGVYCFEAEWLWPHLQQLPVSSKGEYYLTDLVGMAVAEGRQVAVSQLADVAEAQGINTRVHLAHAEATLRQRINERWMLAGVTMIDPASTYIEADVTEIGQDTIIYPNTHLRGATRIGAGCVIGPNAVVIASEIGNYCHVEASTVEQAVLEEHVEIGPYAHLRKGAHLAQGVHMGNFGEVKNSYLGPGTKMGHFSYVGDATVGADVNISAGVITCNYDGVHKNHTDLEDGVFLGSDTMLVAPVRLGRGARTGAGSVVTHDVPAGSLALGVPARVRASRDDGQPSDQ